MSTIPLLLVSLLLSPPVPAAVPGAVGQAAGRSVELIVGDNMKFTPNALSAKPGERITVVLKDVGQMPKAAMGHNFVLMAKGADPKAYADKAASARDTDFIVPALKQQVLAFTKLVGPGETAEVAFNAPKEPGTYTFICSFPGHFAMGMKGTLTVSK